MGLSEQEVATRAGLARDEVRRFAALGILHPREPAGGDGLPSYTDAGVLRARLAVALNTAPPDGEYARPTEVLVTDDVRSSCPTDGEVAFEEIGAVPLRGEPAPVNLHLATRRVSSDALA